MSCTHRLRAPGGNAGCVSRALRTLPQALFCVWNASIGIRLRRCPAEIDSDCARMNAPAWKVSDREIASVPAGTLCKKTKRVVPNSLNLLGRLFGLQLFQRFRLWTKRLLSRTFNTYESRLDFLASRFINSRLIEFLGERRRESRPQKFVGQIPGCDDHNSRRALHFAGTGKADAHQHDGPDGDHVQRRSH